MSSENVGVISGYNNDKTNKNAFAQILDWCCESFVDANFTTERNSDKHYVSDLEKIKNMFKTEQENIIKIPNCNNCDNEEILKCKERQIIEKYENSQKKKMSIQNDINDKVSEKLVNKSIESDYMHNNFADHIKEVYDVLLAKLSNTKLEKSNYIYPEVESQPSITSITEIKKQLNHVSIDESISEDTQNSGTSIKDTKEELNHNSINESISEDTQNSGTSIKDTKEELNHDSIDESISKNYHTRVEEVWEKLLEDIDTELLSQEKYFSVNN